MLEDCGDQDEAIAALLHDAVEDQDAGSPGHGVGRETGLGMHVGLRSARLLPDGLSRW